MESIAGVIKEKAIDLGFSLAGVATTEPSRYFPAYEAWLVRGMHGTMQYLENERGRPTRAALDRILPGVRSVISLGWSYPAGLAETKEDGRPRGLVAAYAWGRDYHIHLVEKIDELCAFITQVADRPLKQRIYTDTGAILEREYAQRAGLGWAGKNTNLIAPGRGSYFLLAEILIDVDLDPDEAFTPDRCGTCRRCLDACPTQCLLPGRVLDARRCIAYLTIEHKGVLPRDLRPAMGTWIFGCDICQQVCPWNVRFSQPQVVYPALDLVAEVRITPQQFRTRYGGTTLERTRRRGYVRNVAVALGNAGDPAGVPALSQALEEDSEPLVRGHAAWALGRLPGPRGRLILDQASRRETHPDVLAEIQYALETL